MGCLYGFCFSPTGSFAVCDPAADPRHGRESSPFTAHPGTDTMPVHVASAGCGRPPENGGVAPNPPAILTGPAPANMCKVLERPEMCRGRPGKPLSNSGGFKQPRGGFSRGCHTLIRSLYTHPENPLQVATPQLADCSAASEQCVLAAIADQAAVAVVFRLLNTICQNFSAQLGMCSISMMQPRSQHT